MDSIMRGIEFLYNNFWKIGLIVIAVSMTVYFTQKLIREAHLNRRLIKFQKKMRHVQFTFKTKRLAGFSLMIVLPALVVAFAFILIRPTSMQYDNHITNITSAEDIFAIYDNYHQKITANVFRATAQDSVGALEDSSPSVPSLNIGIDEPDLVKTDGQYLYVLSEDQLTIILTTEDNVGVHKRISLLLNDAPDLMFYPIGLYVDETRVIVVGNSYEYAYYYDVNRGFQPEFGQGSSVIVRVFDKLDDFTLSDEYVMKGVLSQALKTSDNMVFMIKRAIPFSEGRPNLDDYLPSIKINDSVVESEYKDVLYIEGTRPNGFISVVNINLQQRDVEMKVFFGDCNVEFLVSNEAIYMASVSYKFLEASDMFIVSNPISETRTAISKFSYANAKVEYLDTVMVSGRLISGGSMHTSEGYLIVTTMDEGDVVNNRLYILSEDLSIASTLDRVTDGAYINSVYFIGDCAYLVNQEMGESLHAVNLINPLQPYIEDRLQIPKFSMYFHRLNHQNMIGIGFSDSLDEGVIDSLKVTLYANDGSCAFDTLHTDYILFSDYGYASSEALYNHRAFLYSEIHGKTIFPLNMYDYRPLTRHKSGLIVLEIDAQTGIDFHRFIQHEAETKMYPRYRAMIIDNRLFSISDQYVQVVDLENLDVVLYTIKLYENN